MPTILYRRHLMDAAERAAAAAHFPLTDCVVGIRNDVVIARYRGTFYDELVRDLAAQGSRPINGLTEHEVITSFDWYHHLADLTPRTWFQLHEVPKAGGPFVVKGTTNSKKEQFATAMYAATFADAVRVAGVLQQDHWLAAQPIVVREYVPLVTLELGLNGLRFANEWRLFAYRGALLGAGYYWSGAEPDAKARARLDAAGVAVAQEAATRLADVVPFTAIDVAETEDGRWIVIEVNDGQMAGLSDIDPGPLYAALRGALDAETARAPRCPQPDDAP